MADSWGFAVGKALLGAWDSSSKHSLVLRHRTAPGQTDGAEADRRGETRQGEGCEPRTEPGGVGAMGRSRRGNWTVKEGSLGRTLARALTTGTGLRASQEEGPAKGAAV